MVYVAHAVDHQSQNTAGYIQDHDDRGLVVDLGLHVETFPQIDHRHHRAAQVKHPFDEGRHIGNDGQGLIGNDLVELQDRYAVCLAPQHEGDILR